MSNSDKVFAGSIPDVYDAYVVPFVFESYAADLDARVGGSSRGWERSRPAGTGFIAQR